MGRDKMKSASLHSFHDEHTEPLPPVPAPGTRTPFEGLVREMLDQLGEDPTREGLRQTPARVETSLKWLTRGYHMSVADVIGDALYSERHENLVCVRDIEIYSLCEHHLLPFFGRAHVAYLPNGRLVGLSKIPRVIEVFARRLQVQERLTDQVADALMEVLDPRGVGVVIEAYHLCMMMRGVEKQNSKTVTSALRGGLLHATGAHVVRLARSLVDGMADGRTDLRCDVTDPAAVERAIGRVLTDRGVPDVVVNNAGVFFIKPVAETTPEDFSRTIAVNLLAPFLVTRALVPHLVRRGSGHLVTIGSIADHVAFTGSSAYTATKFGLRGMHEVLRAELSRTGVRTTIVSPGPVDTPIWDPIDPDGRPGFTRRDAMLQAGDVAEAVLFAVTRAPRVDVTEIRLLPTVYSLRG